MSQYMIRQYEGRCTCPKCKDTMQSYPDETFGFRYVCVNCRNVFYSIRTGMTEHEYVVCDNYSESLVELSELDDLK